MDHKKVIIRTTIISVIIWILFYLIGSWINLFVVYCKLGASSCPSQWQMYLSYSIVLLPIIFAITLGINYLVEYLRKSQN